MIKHRFPHPSLRATLSRRERETASLLPSGEGLGMREVFVHQNKNAFEFYYGQQCAKAGI